MQTYLNGNILTVETSNYVNFLPVFLNLNFDAHLLNAKLCDIPFTNAVSSLSLYM